MTFRRFRGKKKKSAEKWYLVYPTRHIVARVLNNMTGANLQFSEACQTPPRVSLYSLRIGNDIQAQHDGRANIRRASMVRTTFPVIPFKPVFFFHTRYHYYLSWKWFKRYHFHLSMVLKTFPLPRGTTISNPHEVPTLWFFC